MTEAVPFKLRPAGAPACRPILMIGLPNGGEWAKFFSHVLIHDLLYSSTSTYINSNANNYEAALKKLSSLDGDALLKLTRKHKGYVILSEDDVLNQQTGNVDMTRLRELEKGDYQAVIVDDTCFIREPDITSFVMKQYAKGASVVVMAIEGIFNLSTINQHFKVNWKFNAYTKRYIRLTDIGKDVIGKEAFPFENKYVKANFVGGGGEMFMEHQFPENYEDEEDYPDGPPPPEPGSPVVTALGKDRSVSYFGFVNPSDVSYGAILLKLCYAKAEAGATGTNSAAPTERKKVMVPGKKLQSVPDLLANGDEESSAVELTMSKVLWMASFLLAAFYFSFELSLRKRGNDDDAGSSSKSEF